MTNLETQVKAIESELREFIFNFSKTIFQCEQVYRQQGKAAALPLMDKVIDLYRSIEERDLSRVYYRKRFHLEYLRTHRRVPRYVRQYVLSSHEAAHEMFLDEVTEQARTYQRNRSIHLN